MESKRKKKVWLVSWDGRYGPNLDKITRKTKAFRNESDALIFIYKLEEAKSLFKNLLQDYFLNIKLEKQK